MTVKLTGNFLRNARGITFTDGGGITWSINSNTNAITANGSAAGAGAANPTAKVGLTVVNGSASTFMRSDGAPPLDQSITPTWTGEHIWGAAQNGFGGAIGTYIIGTVTLYVQAAGTTNLAIKDTTDGVELQNYAYSGGGIIGTASNHSLNIRTNNTNRLTLTAGGVGTFSGQVGFNGVTPPSQLTGFGTPTGNSLVTNFPGSSATLAQCGEMISEILIYMKQLGLIGA